MLDAGLHKVTFSPSVKLCSFSSLEVRAARNRGRIVRSLTCIGSWKECGGLLGAPGTSKKLAKD